MSNGCRECAFDAICASVAVYRKGITINEMEGIPHRITVGEMQMAGEFTHILERFLNDAQIVEHVGAEALWHGLKSSEIIHCVADSLFLRHVTCSMRNGMQSISSRKGDHCRKVIESVDESVVLADAHDVRVRTTQV